MSKSIFVVIVGLLGAGTGVYLGFPPGGWGHHGPVPAPEIDPASAVSALTVLAGSLAVLRGRRASK